jgi:hypothetical protein
VFQAFSISTGAIGVCGLDQTHVQSVFRVVITTISESEDPRAFYLAVTLQMQRLKPELSGKLIQTNALL